MHPAHLVSILQSLGQLLAVLQDRLPRQAIAASEDAHRCFAKRWVEFEHGRALVDEDEGLIDHITNVSMDGANVRTIVREVLTSKAFLSKKAVDQ